MYWFPPFQGAERLQRSSSTRGDKARTTWSSRNQSSKELEETWRDPYWRARFSPDESAAAIALLRTAAIVAPLTVDVVGVATHPEDDLILATAIAGGAFYLVTGDRKLRAVGAFQEVILLSPRDFLELLLAGSEGKQ